MKKNIIIIVLSAILVAICFFVYYNYQLRHDEEVARRLMESEMPMTKQLEEQRHKLDTIGREYINLKIEEGQ